MNHVISQGWAMYWGTARWTPVEVMEAYTNCRQFNCVTPISEQSEYHMFCREKTELYMPELYNKIGELVPCSTLQGNSELHEFMLLGLHCLQEGGSMPSVLQFHFRTLAVCDFSCRRNSRYKYNELT
jgi:hypothetical protein